jgi:hypothetical protein
MAKQQAEKLDNLIKEVGEMRKELAFIKDLLLKIKIVGNEEDENEKERKKQEKEEENKKYVQLIVDSFVQQTNFQQPNAPQASVPKKRKTKEIDEKLREASRNLKNMPYLLSKPVDNFLSFSEWSQQNPNSAITEEDFKEQVIINMYF